MTVFFILSCARSGSTSLARILNEADNGLCAIEPTPNLNVETRLAMDGQLDDPSAVVRNLVLPRVHAAAATTRVYGEKNVTYGPFIPHLYQLTHCKFIFLKRDGRDVVRSLLDWHDCMFGDVYRECADPGELTPRALAAAASLPVHRDTSDFSRPRPTPGSAWDDHWETMSRFEMCAFYWATINDLYRDELDRLPHDAWFELDYTRPDPDDILAAADFCGLSGITRQLVQQLLANHINSLQDRAAGDPVHPRWMDWDARLRRSFHAIAGPTMQRLGFFDHPATRWRPPDYGRCWRDHAADLPWYEWMYDTRRTMHEEALQWIHSFDQSPHPLSSIADFGCGLGVGYADALADRRYVGFDLVESSIDWCRQNRSNPRHEYHHLDFIRHPTPQRYDAVISSGTIDNAYDVEAFLDAMINASSRWIYLTCYRGWFPDLDEHNYSWVDADRCFYTNVAPRRIREFLQQRGCENITVEPRPTGRADIPLETRVIATVPPPAENAPDG